MQLVNRGALAQRLVHDELALAGGVGQQVDELPQRLLVEVLGKAEAIAALLKRANGLLEGFLVGLADGHDLAHGAHLRAQTVLDALELLKGPAGELDDDVVAIGMVLVERAPLAAGNLVEREAAGEHGGDECDGEAGGLGSQCGGTAGTRVDLDDDVAVAHRVVRPLHVGAANNLDGVHDAIALLLEAIDGLLRDGLHGGDAEGVAGVNAHRVDVLDGADGDHLAVGVAHDLKLELLPAEDGLLDEDLVHGACGEATLDHGAQLLDVVHQAAARAAHGVGGAQHAGIAKLAGDVDGLVHAVGNLAPGHLDAQIVHEFLEGLAILAALDGVDLHADDLDAVLVQDAGLGELGGEVERRLAAEVGQDGVGTLLLDDCGEALNVEGLDISAIRGARVRHDGRGVGVDEDDLVSQRPQGLAGLRAGVVKLARLTDDDGARTDDHDFMDVCTLGHGNLALCLGLLPCIV